MKENTSNIIPERTYQEWRETIIKRNLTKDALQKELEAYRTNVKEIKFEIIKNGIKIQELDKSIRRVEKEINTTRLEISIVNSGGSHQPIKPSIRPRRTEMVRKIINRTSYKRIIEGLNLIKNERNRIFKEMSQLNSKITEIGDNINKIKNKIEEIEIGPQSQLQTIMLTSYKQRQQPAGNRIYIFEIIIFQIPQGHRINKRNYYDIIKDKDTCWVLLHEEHLSTNKTNWIIKSRVKELSTIYNIKRKIEIRYSRSRREFTFVEDYSSSSARREQLQLAHSRR